MEEIKNENCCEHSDCHFSVNEKTQINEMVIYDVADFYKVFGDSTRIKILFELLHEEKCVSDLVNSLDMNQSAVSHQLRILRQNDLVKFRKEGKTVYYSLDDQHVALVLEQGLNHILHKKIYGGE